MVFDILEEHFKSKAPKGTGDTFAQSEILLEADFFARDDYV